MAPHPTLTIIAEVYILLCLLCCLYVLYEQSRHPAPMMRVMLWVWPIITLWAGPIGVWLYKTIALAPHTMDMGHGGMKMHGMESVTHGMNMKTKSDMPRSSGMTGMNMPGSEQQGMKHDMKHDMHQAADPHHATWKQITEGTLHCGAGCTIADLIGPWLFLAIPFTLFGHLMFGEWVLDYILALFVGVSFQYAAQRPMSQEQGLPLIWRCFKIDVLSLTSWQIGMYGWMAISTFCLFGPLSPDNPVFWLMMQVSMLCGFFTAYPMNWWLIRIGVKSAM